MSVFVEAAFFAVFAALAAFFVAEALPALATDFASALTVAVVLGAELLGFFGALEEAELVFLAVAFLAGAFVALDLTEVAAVALDAVFFALALVTAFLAAALLAMGVVFLAAFWVAVVVDFLAADANLVLVLSVAADVFVGLAAFFAAPFLAVAMVKLLENKSKRIHSFGTALA